MILIRSLWIKIICLSIVLLISFAIAVADEDEVNVIVSAPEYVTDTFDVTINVTNVSDMNAGQFDLTFDPDVIEFQSVEHGIIDDMEIPIDMFRLFSDSDPNRVRVLVKLDSINSICGTGYVAKIIFDVVGNTGDMCTIGISDEYTRYLSYLIPDDTGRFYVEDIPANWSDTNVTIGTAPPTSTSSYASAVETTSKPKPTATSTRVTVTNSVQTPTIYDSPESQDGADSIQPAEAIQNNDNEIKTDILELLTSINLIAIYSFIGFLAFFYVLILIK